MNKLKLPSVASVVLFLALLAGCQTAQQSDTRLPKSTPTRITFNTNNTRYTGFLGEEGLEGLCRRIRVYLTKDLADKGIAVVSDSDSGQAYPQIAITLSSVELRNLAVFPNLASPKPYAKYTATLESPSGSAVAKWHHELDEGTVDRLSRHMASDIAKYLSRGFR